MKKFVFCLVFCLSVVVSVLVTPLYAQAATTDFITYDWAQILEDNNITIPTSASNGPACYAIFSDSDRYFYILYRNDNVYGSRNIYTNADSISGTTTLYAFQDNTLNDIFTMYKSDNAGNPYGPYTRTVSNGNNGFGAPCSILYGNSTDIRYRQSGATVFQPTPLAPAGSLHPVNSAISSEMLSGILAEVTGVLPILLPVLIVLLAIRKGIRFTLTTLRTA